MVSCKRKSGADALRDMGEDVISFNAPEARVFFLTEYLLSGEGSYTTLQFC